MEKYKKALENFKEEMLEHIVDNFEGDKGMQKAEAECFLGQSVKGWSQEAIDQAVHDIQLAYYTEGMCTFDELVEKYLELC